MEHAKGLQGHYTTGERVRSTFQGVVSRVSKGLCPFGLARDRLAGIARQGEDVVREVVRDEVHDVADRDHADRTSLAVHERDAPVTSVAHETKGIADLVVGR